jgi:hypothetical protein
MQAIYFFRIFAIGPLKHKFMLIGLLLPAKVLSILNQLNPAVNMVGMFLSVGIVRLLNVIILQFATLKYFERRMIL